MQRRDEEKSYATPEKERAFQAFLAATTYYAACSHGHIAWIGDDRQTQAEAQADADAHDAAKHGGTRRAVVLSN
jgi:hypothetical protein